MNLDDPMLLLKDTKHTIMSKGLANGKPFTF